MLSNNDHWPCLYAEWEKLVERRRLNAQEKENNLENRVIQEAGWDGARIQVLDRKRDAPSLKWRMSRKEDRRRECQVEEVYSDSHKCICEGDEITCFTWLGERKVVRQRKIVKIYKTAVRGCTGQWLRAQTLEPGCLWVWILFLPLPSMTKG